VVAEKIKSEMLCLILVAHTLDSVRGSEGSECLHVPYLGLEEVFEGDTADADMCTKLFLLKSSLQSSACTSIRFLKECLSYTMVD
jgi:hypothetical protein